MFASAGLGILGWFVRLKKTERLLLTPYTGRQHLYGQPWYTQRDLVFRWFFRLWCMTSPSIIIETNVVLCPLFPVILSRGEVLYSSHRGLQGKHRKETQGNQRRGRSVFWKCVCEFIFLYRNFLLCYLKFETAMNIFYWIMWLLPYGFCEVWIDIPV